MYVKCDCFSLVLYQLDEQSKIVKVEFFYDRGELLGGLIKGASSDTCVSVSEISSSCPFMKSTGQSCGFGGELNKHGFRIYSEIKEEDECYVVVYQYQITCESQRCRILSNKLHLLRTSQSSPCSTRLDLCRSNVRFVIALCKNLY